MEKVALATTFWVQSSANTEDSAVSVCVCFSELKFFFLGSEEEREGELVDHLGVVCAGTNTFFPKKQSCYLTWLS
jgi:hypothetical protein